MQRIIAALEVEKLVIAASPNGKMRLGPAILRLAASVRTDFASLARPLLIALSKELGETVDLSTVKKDQVVFIDQVTGPHRLRTVSVVGDAYPLHCTANGKAYLAELDDAAIVDLIGRKYQRRTKNTKVSLSDLVADLRAARQTGVAVDLEEHSLGRLRDRRRIARPRGKLRCDLGAGAESALQGRAQDDRTASARNESRAGKADRLAKSLITKEDA